MTETDTLDLIAERIYDHVQANRKDNLTKEKLPSDPRKISCTFGDLAFDEQKNFYRSIAQWYLNNI